MDNEVESALSSLISKNIPFVVFRAPGEGRRLIIQQSVLSQNPPDDIVKRGFYAFPFSEDEPVDPVFFKPDFDLEYSKDCLKNIPLTELPKAPTTVANQYEVEEEEYFADIEQYLSAFENNGINKAIYSRIREEELDGNLDIDDFFIKLCETYKKAFTYVMHIPGNGVWIGASPELLLSYKEGCAQTVALAGTLKINHEVASPEWTRKEIDEHRMVEKYIIALCQEMNLNFEKTPVRTTNTGKVYHLKSEFTIEVESKKINTFLKKLHPTPAISGLPQRKALDLIKKTEKHDRTYYCGFLGYVNDPTDFSLYINLRCMKLDGDTCYLFAGGGITKDSDSRTEWEETNVKMSTLSDLLETNVDYEEISPVSC